MIWNFNWFGIRLAALLILGVTLIDFEITAVILSLIFLHVSSGVKTIVCDYIHIEKLNLIFLVLTRICHVELIRCFIELII
uniref:Succinate:cytochrome c oxidoreductase subunit 4 n=1 Tax=Pterocladiella luxurians TaxID=2909240 RepID=A0A1D8X7B8_9FLOR|nr:succinate:cytochrome c oxidoreductase subunit 4 [Gelidium crinale f. luxurians]